MRSVLQLALLAFLSNNSYGQECKLAGKDIVIKYSGDCSNGYANGKGTSYYQDSSYYTGKFENGLREGKGEMHFISKDGKDSIVKGFWSGDIFRGKRYQQYSYENEKSLPITEFSFVGKSNNRLTFQIDYAKEGNLTESTLAQLGRYIPRVLKLTPLNPGGIVTLVSINESDMSARYVYTINAYPVKLEASLSNGKKMVFELNRSGEWIIRNYIAEKVISKLEARPRG